MKKNIYLGIFFLFMLNAEAFNKKDSNMIEIGRTYSTLLNKAGYNYGYNINSFYLGYSRLTPKKKLFFKADFHHYQQYNGKNIDNISYEKTKQGDVYSTTYSVFRLGLGKNYKINRFIFMPYLSLNYRFGKGEEMFWLWMSSGPYKHFYSNYSRYNSIGSSIGVSINYNFYKKWIIGVDNNFNYYIQKINLKNTQDETPEFKDYYKPNRMSFCTHIKLGYRF